MFKPVGGVRYYKFLRFLHSNLLFDWYMEVGCRTGESFASVRGKTIAVDPFFRAEANIIQTKPALHVFQTKSDDFFASGFLASNGIRLGLSFLDGMHLFEFLLRDFINTEAQSDPQGVIMLHDCVPRNLEMTTRDLDRLPKGAWTGDVWKLIPILQKWRPDLELTVLDCKPTGLVCVRNLRPGDSTLTDHYDEICAEFAEQDLQEYGIERFFASFEPRSASECMKTGFELFRPASIDPALAQRPRRVTP